MGLWHDRLTRQSTSARTTVVAFLCALFDESLVGGSPEWPKRRERLRPQEQACRVLRLVLLDGSWLKRLQPSRSIWRGDCGHSTSVHSMAAEHSRLHVIMSLEQTDQSQRQPQRSASTIFQ